MDLVFVLDLSGSVGKTNWEENMRPFVRELSNQFTIGPDNAQVGVVSFNSKATLRWGLAEHTTNQAFINAINNLPYKGVSNASRFYFYFFYFLLT